MESLLLIKVFLVQSFFCRRMAEQGYCNPRKEPEPRISFNLSQLFNYYQTLNDKETAFAIVTICGLADEMDAIA
jgi:hypothetical protein